MALPITQARYDDEPGPNVLAWVFVLIVVLLVLAGLYWLLRDSALLGGQPETNIDIEAPAPGGQDGNGGTGGPGGTDGGTEAPGGVPSLPST